MGRRYPALPSGQSSPLGGGGAGEAGLHLAGMAVPENRQELGQDWSDVEREGREGLDLAGSPWTGIDVYGGAGCWLVLQTRGRVEGVRARPSSLQGGLSTFQPQRCPKAFPFSAG